MSPLTLAPQNVAQSAIGFTGPLLIAGLVHWSLLGTFLIQLYSYNTSQRSKYDSLLVKSCVYGTVILQILAFVFVTHAIWVCLVTNWGVVSIMTSTPWSATLAALTTATSTSVVQVFFAWRIWGLSQTMIPKIVTVFAIMVSLLQWSACLTFVIKYFLFNDDYIKIVKLDPIAEIWLSAAAAGDWIIGVTFVAILQQQKRKSPFITTQHLLDKVIVNVVESGLITATLALLDLILFKTLPTTTAHVTVEFALGSLYANVLMANLNSREKLMDSTRKGLERSQSFGLNPLQSTHMSTIGHIGDVHISTEVVQHDDHSGFHMIKDHKPSHLTAD